MSLFGLRSMWRSPFLPRKTMLDYHDDWNIIAIGALNVAQIAWWAGLASGGTALNVIYYADIAYFITDACWLVFVPSCVPQAVRGSLLVHHFVLCCCAPFAMGRPVLQCHLLRAWAVELHSWAHIGARRLREPVASLCATVNKPLFFVLRLIAFPASWFVYAHQRAQLPAELMAAHTPNIVHIPLSFAHLAMYGLMLNWGKKMFLG